MGRESLDGVDWRSFQLGWFWPMGFGRHLRRLHEIAVAFEPDIVVGASDAAHVTLAASVSARRRVPLALDLYDDFESYGATKLPGLKAGLIRGISQAAAITTVSFNLAAKVEREYRTSAIIRTITNAVCPDIFRPGDKSVARQRLGLPQSGLLIGTAGTLSPRRGIGTLIKAFEKIAASNTDVFLILAGPIGHGFRLRTNARIRYLGELPHRDVGCLFNALDVGVVYNRQDQFAEYGFPQKLYEMVACGLPLVAADVGAVGALLSGGEAALYDPDNVESLTHAIAKQLRVRRVADLVVPTWRDRGTEFHGLLEETLQSAGKAELNTAFGDVPRYLGHPGGKA